MTQIVITVEDKSILPHIKGVLKAVKGVTITSVKTTKKTGLEEAYEDVKAGRINRYDNVDEMLDKILG